MCMREQSKGKREEGGFLFVRFVLWSFAWFWEGKAHVCIQWAGWCFIMDHVSEICPPHYITRSTDLQSRRTDAYQNNHLI